MKKAARPAPDGVIDGGVACAFGPLGPASLPLQH